MTPPTTSRPARSCVVCGNPLDPTASVCLECGHVYPLAPADGVLPMADYGGGALTTPARASVVAVSERKALPAFLLCLLLGCFGAHRFYLGRWKTGVLQLLTLGGAGLWMLADLILVATGQLRDGDGLPVRDWM